MMCHSIAKVKSTMGQADFQLEFPALHRMAASANPLVRRFHDFLIELNPEPHRRAFPEAVYAHADGGFLLDVPQSASRCSGKSLSLGARVQ